MLSENNISTCTIVDHTLIDDYNNNRMSCIVCLSCRDFPLHLLQNNVPAVVIMVILTILIRM